MPVKHAYLAANQTLAPGDSLVSPNGKYVAYFKDDGQLSLCFTVEGSSTPDWDRCYWQSPTSPGTQPWGVMQEDGNFVLYNGPQSGSVAYFASNTKLDRAFVTTVLDDGNLVVCTGVPPGGPEEIVWSALPQISAECKFMQNYRITAPVNGGPEVLAIRNKHDAIELFTIGTGGDVYTFWPDAESETGYGQAPVITGKKISHLAGAADGSGNIVLFASAGTGNEIYSLTETSDPANRWAQPVLIGGVKGPATDLVARNIGGTIWLLVMQKTSSAYEPAILRWAAGNNTMLQSPGLSFTSSPPAVLQTAGSPAEPTATFLTAQKIITWGLVSGHEAGHPADARVPVALDIATDGAGAEWIVGVLDGQVYQLATSGSSYSWNQLWAGISYTNFSVKFQDVVVEADDSGGINIFAVSTPMAIVDGDATPYNVLYHRPPPAQAGQEPVPIYKSSGMRLAGVANNAGNIDLFAVSAVNSVTRLFAEDDGSNWIEEQVLLDAKDSDDAPVIEFSSYATDITLYDGDQAVLSDELVQVYASDRARIEINGLTFFIDEHTAAHVSTNDAGMLCMTQEAGSLASPLLQIQLSADRMSAKAPIIVVEPYADVHLTLGDQTADSLLDAKVTNDDGTQSELLQGIYRDDTTTQSLADALQNFLGDTQHQGGLQARGPALAAAASGPTSGRRPKTGRERDRFWSRQAPHPGGLRQLGALTPGQPCRLTFRDDGFTFERLTAAEAARLRAHKLATLPHVSATGIGKWLSKIGDALRAVVDGIAKVGQVIFDGITATLDLIVDGITYAFEAVVQLVQDAFDMAQMIFNHVKVFFEQLYRWLAMLFDWTSITQTKRLVANSFSQLMEFFKQAVDQLRPQVQSRFAGFKTEFAAMMDQAIGNVAKDYSIGGYDQRNSAYDADASSATSNNFFLNEFVSNTGSSGPSAALAVATSDPVSTLCDLLATLTSVEESSTDSFNQALGYFQDLGTQPDQIFSQLFKGMLSALKGLGLVGIDLAGQIADALLDAVSAIVDALVQAVTQPLSIPFVSRFYKWIMKEDLTLLNVVSLATAIPTAIIYALITGEPLFTAESGPGSADDFTNVITWQNMLQASGLAPESLRAASGPIPTVTRRMARGMAGAYLAVTLLGGYLTGLAEFKLVDNDLKPGWISYAAMVTSGLSSVFSFPWFYADTGSLSEDGEIWFASCIALWLITALGTRLCTWNSTPDQKQKAENYRAIATTVSGACLLAQGAWLSRAESDGRLVAWRILQRIPWSLNFLRHKTVRNKTKGVSLIVLAGTDVLCGYSCAILGYLVLRDRYDVAGTRAHAATAPA